MKPRAQYLKTALGILVFCTFGGTLGGFDPLGTIGGLLLPFGCLQASGSMRTIFLGIFRERITQAHAKKEGSFFKCFLKGSYPYLKAFLTDSYLFLRRSEGIPILFF